MSLSCHQILHKAKLEVNLKVPAQAKYQWEAQGMSRILRKIVKFLLLFFS